MANLTPHFTQADLTQTSTGKPNVPTKQDQIYLQKLANVLEELYTKIGPFKVTSGYRSQAVQNSLISGGNPRAVPKSLHSLGQAADIKPTTMSGTEYWKKIVTNDFYRKKLGEISLLRSGGIHVSLPTTSKQGLPMYEALSGAYIILKLTEIKSFLLSRGIKTIALPGIPMIALAVGLFLLLTTSRGKEIQEQIKAKAQGAMA
jgi:hypothetical protein